MAYESVTMGGETPRTHGNLTGPDWCSWYKDPVGGRVSDKGIYSQEAPSPCAQHEEALRALPPLAYIKEWAKAQKVHAPTPIRRKPGRRPRLDPVKWSALAAFDTALNAAEAVMEARSHAA